MKFGFGRTDITPLESVPLAGYGNDTSRYSDSVDYRLYATCLAFADEEAAPVLVYTLDLCVPPYHRFRDWAMPALAKAAGVDPDRILLACTHNHSGPSLDEAREPAIARYMPYLIEKLTETARQALSDLAEELKSLTEPVFLVGDGSNLTYKTLSAEIPGLVLPPEHRMHQRATGVALLAKAKIEAGEIGDGNALTPNYLRLSQAERERLEKEKK